MTANYQIINHTFTRLKPLILEKIFLFRGALFSYPYFFVLFIYFLIVVGGYWLKTRISLILKTKASVENLEYVRSRDNIVIDLKTKLGLKLKSIDIDASSTYGVGGSLCSEHITFDAQEHSGIDSVCIEFCREDKSINFKAVKITKISLKNEPVSKKDIATFSNKILNILLNNTNNHKYKKTFEYIVPFVEHHVMNIILKLSLSSKNNIELFGNMKNRVINFESYRIEFLWDNFSTQYYITMESSPYEFGSIKFQKHSNRGAKVPIVKKLVAYYPGNNSLTKEIEKLIYQEESY